MTTLNACSIHRDNGFHIIRYSITFAIVPLIFSVPPVILRKDRQHRMGTLKLTPFKIYRLSVDRLVSSAYVMRVHPGTTSSIPATPWQSSITQATLTALGSQSDSARQNLTNLYCTNSHRQSPAMLAED